MTLSMLSMHYFIVESIIIKVWIWLVQVHNGFIEAHRLQWIVTGVARANGPSLSMNMNRA